MALEFREAIREAIAEEMERDERVILLGEDVADAGGVFKVTEGLVDRFGPQRVVDTPISELAIAGAAFGGAVTGMRPIIEIMFGDFMALPMDSLVNQAAKYWYLSNGQTAFRWSSAAAVGAGGRFGADPLPDPGTWMHGVPGLKIVLPLDLGRRPGLLRAAIRDPDPVVFLEHKRLYASRASSTSRSRIGSARPRSPRRATTSRSPSI